MIETEKNEFNLVADVKDYFAEHSLGVWAQVVARDRLRAPRGMVTDGFIRVLQAVAQDNEAAIVGMLFRGGSEAQDVLAVMNFLWREKSRQEEAARASFMQTGRWA